MVEKLLDHRESRMEMNAWLVETEKDGHWSHLAVDVYTDMKEAFSKAGWLVEHGQHVQIIRRHTQTVIAEYVQEIV